MNKDILILTMTLLLLVISPCSSSDQNLTSVEISEKSAWIEYEKVLQKMSIPNIKYGIAESRKNEERNCPTIESDHIKTNIPIVNAGRLGQENWSPIIDLSEQDVAEVNKMILLSGDEDTYNLFRLMPDEFMKWIRSEQHISLISLATATHETNHVMNNLLWSCNKWQFAYYFKSHSYPTELHLNDTINYSVIDELIPASLKSPNITLKNYNNYIIKNKDIKGKDFLILLGELNAYLTGANFEANLINTELYDKFLTSGVQSYGGNLTGMNEFMLYALYYLKVTRAQHSSSDQTYIKIKNSPLLRAHLARLWHESEATLDRFFKYTVGNGGLFEEDPDLLRAIYSKELLHELDLLNIPHRNANDWDNTYLSDTYIIKNIHSK